MGELIVSYLPCQLCEETGRGIARWTVKTNVKSRETVMMMPCQHKTRVYEKASYAGYGSFLGYFCRTILPKRYLPEPPCQSCSQDGGTVQEFFDQQLQEL